MGASSSSTQDNEAKQRTKQIDQQLEEDARATRDDIKLLLLGAGESGKSTIAKQMHILHMEGFSEEDRQAYLPVVYSNTIEVMSTIVAAMHALGVEFAGDKLTLQEDAERIADLQASFDGAERRRFSPSTLAALQRLWADAGVRRCHERSNEYQLNDSASYWLDSLARLAAEEYSPTDQDILRIRQVSAGVAEVRFTMRAVPFVLLDVAGQRSERRKWIQCFDNVTAILFVVAISEYDQVIREDGVTNRMHEGFKLFETIRLNPLFTSTAIILFLNKRDLFEKKLARGTTPLQKCFADYTGADEYTEATEFLQWKFQGVLPESSTYTHLTCATDTDNIKFVFAAVADVIIGNNLQNTGIA